MKLSFSAGAFVLLAAFALNVTAAEANPTATITSKNNWTTTAVYSSPSGCPATVNPAFGNLSAGATVPYTARSGFPSLLRHTTIRWRKLTSFTVVVWRNFNGNGE